LPSVVKLSWSDAAANTTTVPETFGALEVDAAVPDGVVLSGDLSLEDEQAESASSIAAPAAAAQMVRGSEIRVVTETLSLPR
jgi:hypothetical protein